MIKKSLKSLKQTNQMIAFKFSIMTTLLLAVSMLFSCNSTKSKNTKTAETIETVKAVETVKKSDSVFIYSELIVSIKKGTPVEAVLAEFETYELKKKKAISSVMGMWLLTYNMDTIIPEEMLEKIRGSEKVVNAEFNKNLTRRE